MLSFKDISDIDMIKTFLVNHNIGDRFSPKGLFFGAFDNEILFGVIQILLEDGKVYIHYIFLDEKYRGESLGNAMVKSLFNKLDVNGFETVYSRVENSYLEKVGFTKVNGEYQCDLVKMFSCSCNCSVGE